MQTAEEFFKENKASGLAYEYGHNVEVVSLSFALELAKRYAYKVAQQALNEADAKIHDYISYNNSAYNVSYNKASELINEVEIKTP